MDLVRYKMCALLSDRTTDDNNRSINIHIHKMTQKPIKVAFVCTGNICRSPMAEAVFANTIKTQGLSDKVSEVDSFGTHSYHIGELPDRRTLQTLEHHKVPWKHTAQAIRGSDFNYFDYILCMDEYNLSSLEKKKPAGSKAIVKLFGEWRDDKSDEKIIDDPYYGGINGFQTCYEQCVHFTDVFIKRELK